MSEFLVEAYRPSPAPDRLPSRGDVAAAAQQLTREGQPVRLVGTVDVPDDETCLYLFEAVSTEAVVKTAQRCGLRYERLVRARSA